MNLDDLTYTVRLRGAWRIRVAAPVLRVGLILRVPASLLRRIYVWAEDGLVAEVSGPRGHRDRIPISGAAR